MNFIGFYNRDPFKSVPVFGIFSVSLLQLLQSPCDMYNILQFFFFLDKKQFMVLYSYDRMPYVYNTINFLNLTIHTHISTAVMLKIYHAHYIMC